jgi:hypothetical protein
VQKALNHESCNACNADESTRPSKTFELETTFNELHVGLSRTHILYKRLRVDVTVKRRVGNADVSGG